MNWTFSHLSNLISNPDRHKLLLEGNWGLEKEAHRTTLYGDLALTDHPLAFGDKLENPYITTDFSESQLELVTPTFQSVEDTYGFLKILQEKVEKVLDNELLWPLSMPPRLPDEEKIPIAKFNDTSKGMEQDIYRRGLALRYGKKMQMISGLHYNFSFSDQMLDFLYDQFGTGKEKQSFINEVYFSLARNYLRYRWLLIYLFGASPAIDPTFYSVLNRELEVVRICCPACCSNENRYEQYATSLRVSRFGYSNTIQREYNVSYNGLKEHIQGLRTLMETPSKKYKKLGTVKSGQTVQLNSNILQKDSEFYSSIRFRQNAYRGETQLDALERRGVKYVEVRILDLNPFEKLSISLEQLYFMQVFVLFCLFEHSQFIDDSELKKINTNHHLVALSGRKPNLMLHKYDGSMILLKDWGDNILEKLKSIASLMDQATDGNRYVACVLNERKKVEDLSLLPSSLIYKEMREKNESHLDFGVRRAKVNRCQNILEEKFNFDHEATSQYISFY